MKYIERISGNIKNSNININININGRNLLIAGGNGSGKTSLLKDVYVSLHHLITEGAAPDIPNSEKGLKALNENLSKETNPIERRDLISDIREVERNLDLLIKPLRIDIQSARDFIDLKRKHIAVIRLFSADRKADILHAHSASGTQLIIDKNNIEGNQGTLLEQHLLNLKIRAALDIYSTDNLTRSRDIAIWFSKFTDDLKYLFENDSTELVFDVETLKFTISQHGRPPFNFQNLSSGYMSIFDIYADLLMRTEYMHTTPTELRGVVLIDELDAHLHVSLQRKILPFLTRSFPNIQFIITTHSPFVLTSVDDSLVYDITTGRECEDLSMYSFEAVLEGLLGVPPISKQFEETIKYLMIETQKDIFDITETEIILNRIEPHTDTLDPESEMFYHLAKNRVLKAKFRKS